MPDAPNAAPDQTPANETDARERLERTAFHFRILLETSNELAGSGKVRDILNRFLLQAMGPPRGGRGHRGLVPS